MQKQPNRFFRWLFILGLVFLALLFLLRCIPQEPLRHWAADKISAKIGKPVEIGPIHFGLRTITIDQVQIADLTASGIRLNPDLTTLWAGIDFKKRTLTRSGGQLEIAGLRHPHYKAKAISLRWHLTDMDPTGSHLTGWATFDQGPGLLEHLDKLGGASSSAKMVMAPLAALTSLDQIGAMHLGLPNLDHWPIQGIKGRYQFNQGIMDIQLFELSSAELLVTMTGAIRLVDGKITAELGLKSPPSVTTGALDVKAHIMGTVSHPKVDLESLKKKAFRATLTHLLDPRQTMDVKNQLKNLFR